MERLVKYIIGLFTDKTFMKFVIVGIVNTIVGTTICLYSIMYLDSAIGYHLPLTTSLAASVATFLINISHSKIRNMDGNRLCASRLIS